MLARFALLAVCLALAGCGGPAEQAPTPQPSLVADAPPEIPVMGPERRILAFGDSLLTGYGLDNGESYPAQLEAALRARGINARITNAGVSGDTTLAGLERLGFALDNQPQPPELVILSLGGNDMLRGVPPGETRKNLTAILEELQSRKVPVLMMGMLAAPNLGADYAKEFNAIYPALASQYDAALVPFFLQSVIDRPDLIQPDHVHPTAPGIDAMVKDTLDDVEGALGANS